MLFLWAHSPDKKFCYRPRKKRKKKAAFNRLCRKKVKSLSTRLGFLFTSCSTAFTERKLGSLSSLVALYSALCYNRPGGVSKPVDTFVLLRKKRSRETGNFFRCEKNGHFSRTMHHVIICHLSRQVTKLEVPVSQAK